MSFWKYFSRDAIVESLQGRNLESAIDELLEALVRAKSITAAVSKKARAAIEVKIREGATGAIGHGVAIPHVKVPQVKSTVAALGRSREGIDFRAGDGTTVKLCFFVVGPEDAPQQHLEFLRWIANLARDPDFPRFALQCRTKGDLLELLKEVSEP